MLAMGSNITDVLVGVDVMLFCFILMNIIFCNVTNILYIYPSNI